MDNYSSDILRLHPGSSIMVEGTLISSEGKEQSVEISAERIGVFGFSDPMSYALGKQRVSFERLREVAHLRPRTNTFGSVSRIRNVLAFETHRFFQDRGFLYIHTPIITASDCEGAGAMFQVTTLNPENPPRQEAGGGIDYRQDFFGKRSFLTVSGQIEVETHCCALGDVYTFGPTFRAENSNTRRHLAEFWMIEPEIAFADLQDDADLAEAYIRHLVRSVLDRCPDDLAFFDSRIASGLTARLQGIVASDRFPRISYTDAIEILGRPGNSFEFPVEWGKDLQSEHERHLTEEVFHSPVVVTDYPKEIKAFYMRLNDDGRTVAAMDILLPGVGEIIGGSQREERLDILDGRLRECDLDPERYWWYRDLREYGTIPHAGFGLGFERIVQFCTGMHNIRDVIPFPRTPGCIEF
jgi:asparaginyl-tRNA synthetase